MRRLRLIAQNQAQICMNPESTLCHNAPLSGSGVDSLYVKMILMTKSSLV